MDDPASVAVAVDGVSAGSASVVGALLLVLVWAFKEALTIGFKWLWVRISGPPKTALGSTALPHTDLVERPLIEDHFFFATVGELIKNRVPELSCGCMVRTQILRDMMTDYLSSWRDYFTEFIAAEVIDDGFESRSPRHAAQFAGRVSTMLLDLREEVEERWRRRGIPQEAVIAFSAWNYKLVELATSHSDKIVYGVFFTTNRQRIIVLMAQHALFLSAVMVEAGSVLRSMNGTLTGKTYNGLNVAAVDDHCVISVDDTGSGAAAKARTRGTTGGMPKQQKNRSGEWRLNRRVTSTEKAQPERSKLDHHAAPQDRDSDGL